MINDPLTRADLDKYAADNQFSLSKIPFHVHNGTDSPSVDVSSISFSPNLSSYRFIDTDAATITMNWGIGGVHSVTLGGNRTISWVNLLDGQFIFVSLRQDATGTRTVTWPSTVSWSGGVAPTLTVTAAKTDIFVFVRNTTDNKEYGYTFGLNF